MTAIYDKLAAVHALLRDDEIIYEGSTIRAADVAFFLSVDAPPVTFSHHQLETMPAETIAAMLRDVAGR